MLDAKFHTETLMEDKHQALLKLSEQIEQLDVDRLEYLIELAQLSSANAPNIALNTANRLPPLPLAALNWSILNQSLKVEPTN